MPHKLNIKYIIAALFLSISISTQANNNEYWLKLINQQHLFNSKGEYKKAISVGSKALKIAQKNFGTKNLDTALSMNNLAQSHTAIGDYKIALDLQVNALKLYRELLAIDHPDIATNLNNISLTHLYLGQYQESIIFQNEALQIREKILGLDHQDTATSLNNLASAYLFLADYKEALELQLRSLSIRSIKIKENPIGIANIFNNIARTYFYLGQFEQSFFYEKKALEIVKSELGSNHPRTATSLSNIASTLRQLHKYAESLEYETTALEIRMSRLGLNHIDTARSIESIAQLFALNSDFTQAIDLQLTVIDIKTKALGENNSNTLLSLNNLSNMYFESGNIQKSISILNSSIIKIETALGSNHPITATFFSNLAYAHAFNGDKDLAIIYYKRSINAIQSQRELVSKIGESELKSFTGTKSFIYTNLANLLIELGRLSEAMQVLEMTKENEQFEFIRRSKDADPRNSRIDYTAKEKLWMTRYFEISDKLAALGAEQQALKKQSKLGLSNAQKQKQKALFRDLAIAQKGFESFVMELRNSFVQKGPARTVEVLETSQEALRETQDLLKVLEGDTVLLQYYVTEDKVGMLLTTSGVQLARTTLVNSKELNRKIFEYRRSLRDPKADTLPAAQALYRLLLSPLEKDLEQAGAKNIMLSLDGPLRYLPFAALHDGTQHLVQRWNMPMYTSVTKHKLRDAVTPQWQAAGLGLTRAVGKFSALPAVKGEMSSIVKTGVTGVLPGEVYLDEAFNAARFKEVSQRKFQLLHVASHFQFSPGTEINSFLLLGDGQQLTLGTCGPRTTDSTMWTC